MQPTDHVLLVTFGLAGLTSEDYRTQCQAIAPRFAALPGLRSKLWLADPDTNTYGGLYRWSGPEATRDYLAGPIFQALRANPTVAGLAVREFSVLEEPTRVTGRLDDA